jgi:(1->4)-alpha-D-glucan 1-alpha-D-glucosylmutase
VVLVVVPRLLGGLMGEQGRLAVGESAWGDTWLELPEETRDEKWANAFTAETLSMETRNEKRGFGLARLFKIFPYALLETTMP